MSGIYGMYDIIRCKVQGLRRVVGQVGSGSHLGFLVIRSLSLTPTLVDFEDEAVVGV